MLDQGRGVEKRGDGTNSPRPNFRTSVRVHKTSQHATQAEGTTACPGEIGQTQTNQPYLLFRWCLVVSADALQNVVTLEHLDPRREKNEDQKSTR